MISGIVRVSYSSPARPCKSDLFECLHREGRAHIYSQRDEEIQDGRASKRKEEPREELWKAVSGR